MVCAVLLELYVYHNLTGIRSNGVQKHSHEGLGITGPEKYLKRKKDDQIHPYAPGGAELGSKTQWYSVADLCLYNSEMVCRGYRLPAKRRVVAFLDGCGVEQQLCNWPETIPEILSVNTSRAQVAWGLTDPATTLQMWGIRCQWIHLGITSTSTTQGELNWWRANSAPQSQRLWEDGSGIF